MTSEELKNRTKAFALRVMNLIEALPNSIKGRAIANQIVLSGMSVAANRAACRARSRAEFVSRIGVVEKEADETARWLELIIEDKILADKKVMPLHNEANELVAIMAASYKSARSPTKSEITNQKSKI